MRARAIEPRRIALRILQPRDEREARRGGVTRAVQASQPVLISRVGVAIAGKLVDDEQTRVLSGQLGSGLPTRRDDLNRVAGRPDHGGHKRLAECRDVVGGAVVARPEHLAKEGRSEAWEVNDSNVWGGDVAEGVLEAL